MSTGKYRWIPGRRTRPVRRCAESAGSARCGAPPSRHTAPRSHPAEASRRGGQRGAARGRVAFIRDCDAIDEMERIAFGNGAFFVPLDGTAADIAHAGDGDAVDREMGGADAFDLAAVGGGIA